VRKSPLVRLGDMVDILSGFAFSSEQFGDFGVLPLVRIRDVLPGRSSTFYRGDYDPKFIVHNGDILIGMDGEFNRARWEGGEALLNQRVCRIAVSSLKLDNAYLFHFLPVALKAIEAVTPYVTVKHLSVKTICDIEIPLPPLLEQQRIADMLGRVEASRAKRRAALAQLDTLTQSIFRDMFGDHHAIFVKWPSKKLGDLLDFLTSGSRGWATHYADSGDLFLRIQNVRYDELLLNDVAYVSAPETAEARRTRVEPGDVLLSITADLGRSAVVPKDIGIAFVNQHLSILRSKILVPRFLSAYLASPVAQRQISGRNKKAVKAGLNFDDIRSLDVPFPPLALQQDFARRADFSDKLKTLHRASFAEMGALSASLQHRAFQGEL
jgi:type I restriction enzyme S subunit